MTGLRPLTVELPELTPDEAYKLHDFLVRLLEVLRDRYAAEIDDCFREDHAEPDPGPATDDDISF